MSKKKDQVRPQQADGIQEFDNEMPRWWVGLFYLTVVIGVGYGVYMFAFSGTTLIETYNQDMEALAAKQEEALQVVAGSEGDSAETVAENLAAKLESPEMIAAGSAVYQTNCMPCHAPDGGGSVGPNLTDQYWLHGGKASDVYKVISVGVPEKGMIAWGPILGREKVEQATAFVLSLQGTTPANPKDSQGELLE